MAKFTKPNVNSVWASEATTYIIAPDNSKILSGWVVEKPPVQTFNWIDNRQDQMLAYLNQQGIPEWDSSTEYEIETSFIQGTDGLIYKSTAVNTNVNPVTDTTGTWIIPFAEWVSTPSTATSSGKAGQVSQDGTYLYVCTASNTWKRTAISGW